MLFRLFQSFALLTLLLGSASLLQCQSTDSFKQLVEQANAAKEAGRTDEAIALFERAVQLGPRSPQVRWEYGRTLYDLDHFPEAAIQFRELIKMAPQSGIAVGMLGLCEFELKSYSESSAHLDEALLLGLPDTDIEHVVSYHSALAAIIDRKFDQANQILAKLISSGSVPAQMRTAMGLALLHMPLLPDALDLKNKELVFVAGDAAVELSLKRFSEAEKTLTGMISQNPRAPFLHLALARAINEQGRPQDAIQQLKAEEEISGETDETRALNTEIVGRKPQPNTQPPGAHYDSARFEILSQKAMAEAQAGKTTSALRAFDEALALNPTWREGLNAAGSLAYAEGNFPTAADYLRKLTALDSTAGTAFAMLGLCEFETKDFDSAFRHLRQGHELGMQGTPDAVIKANYHLAILYTARSDFDRALDLLKQIAIYPSLGDKSKFAMGLTLLQMPVLPDQVSPAERPLVAKAGEAAGLLSISHYPEAFAILERMLVDSPTRPGIHNAYGWALLSVSRYDEAEAQFRAESAIAPQNPTPLVGLASTALKTRRLQIALEASKQAVILAPRSGRAREIYGRVLLESGDTNQAIAELEKAADLSIDLPQAHFSLARAYEAANRPLDAERERQQFQKLKR